MRFSKKLTAWVGSFVMAAVLLVYYVHVPVGPVLLAGGLTLVITVIRHLTRLKETL